MSFGFDFFLSRGLYGSRRVGHFDAYVSTPGSYTLEAGDWTLEITVPTRLTPRTLIPSAVAAGALVVSVLATLADVVS